MNKDLSTNRYPIAFQMWKNGEWQKSATYTSDSFCESGETQFEAFCNRHYEYLANGNSQASLVICNNEEEETQMMECYFEE